MTRFSFLVLVFFVGGASVAAQDRPEHLFVNVYTPNPQHGTVTPLRLFLKGHEVQVLSVDRSPDVPLDVVFVLDNGSHQQNLMGLAQDNVALLASSIRETVTRFTVLLAAREPQILEETSNASELASRQVQNKIAQQSSGSDGADLAGGIEEAAHLLKTLEGVRVIIVVSDEDENISSSALQQLKQEVVSAHILCYSFLLQSTISSVRRPGARGASGYTSLPISRGASSTKPIGRTARPIRNL